MTKKSNSGYIYILLSAIFFALGGLLIKSNSWSSMSINGLRGLIAFFMILLDMKLRHHKFIFNIQVLLGALTNFAMSSLFVMANKMTTAANAIVLQFTMPVFIIIFLWIFWKQKPEAISIITIGISFMGMIFFFMGQLTATGMLGNICAIVSGLFYAIVILMKKIPKSDFESSVLISFAICFVVGIPFFLQEGSYPTDNFITVILLGVFQIGCAYICLNRGLNDVPPVAASLISMIEPVLNPILVAVFCHEYIGVNEIIGSVIVLSSAVFYNLITIKRAQKKGEEP